MHRGAAIAAGAAIPNGRIMTTCATPAELLLFAIAHSNIVAADALSDHVRDCAACQERVAELKTRLAELARTRVAVADHLDDLAFAEVADTMHARDLDDASLEHLARCEQCSGALSEIVSLVRDPFVRAELDRDGPLSIVAGGARENRSLDTRRLRGHPRRIALAALAAAAGLLLTVRLLPWHRAGAEPPTVIRHATIDVARAPRLVSPLGSVSRVHALTWTSVPRADRYRVSVFDGAGQVVWEDELSDTTVTPPVGVLGRSTGELRWRVKARTSFDRWIDSEFAEFSLRGDQ
jgi:hypothetical protein